MYLHQIDINNFRLLKRVTFSFEKRTTVIVGRNNSGKTSLTELFRRLLDDKLPSFHLADFSLLTHEDFWKAFEYFQLGNIEEVRKELPCILIKLTVNYADNDEDYGPLSASIIDFNDASTNALINISYQIRDGEITNFFKDINLSEEATPELKKEKFFRTITERLPKHYSPIVYAENPNDATNWKSMEWVELQRILKGNFINAQRGLNDVTHKENEVLGKILEELLKIAMSDSAEQSDKEIALKLESAVNEVQQNIDDGFNKILKGLLPAFEIFGYPGLSDPRLLTETTLNVERLLSNHTKVKYSGLNGINLPESYNGLGARNLIFILLQIIKFFKDFMATPSEPGLHLIFIEEPEVHLHPQMQEVFIKKISEIVEQLTTNREWPVQFIVTTHSAHLANASPFSAMRYFHSINDKQTGHICFTNVKDLRTNLKNDDFLHKYLTLTRCDLLFADKAILIEGPSERILMPQMIFISEVGADSSLAKISNQYISIVEVGGAYAHLFFDFLKFLELPTLIISDLDSAKKNSNSKLAACNVSESTHTTNATIKKWFGDKKISPSSLIKKKESDKVKGMIRIAYQIPEVDGGPCPRSLEDAFVLANPLLFGLNGNGNTPLELEAQEIAEKFRKTDFAVHYGITEVSWKIPRYIIEGLSWLSNWGNTKIQEVSE
jgi:putative ATP-dependent endonuclease of OLD family